MSAYVQNLAKTDKAQYERLVELMRFYNMHDIDMRLILQLKQIFITKESPEPIQHIPLHAFKETTRNVFKHYRTVDDIVRGTGECIFEEKVKDGVK